MLVFPRLSEELLQLALTATRIERGSDSQNQSMASNSMDSTFFFMFDILVRAKHIEVSVKPHKSRNFWIKSVIFVVFEIKRHYCFRLMYDVQFVHFIQTKDFKLLRDFYSEIYESNSEKPFESKL